MGVGVGVCACDRPVWEEHALSKASSPEEEKVGSTKRKAVALIPTTLQNDGDDGWTLSIYNFFSNQQLEVLLKK